MGRPEPGRDEAGAAGGGRAPERADHLRAGRRKDRHHGARHDTTSPRYYSAAARERGRSLAFVVHVFWPTFGAPWRKSPQKSYEILSKYTPRASANPARLDLTDCPYMWPYCKQPLYAVRRRPPAEGFPLLSPCLACGARVCHPASLGVRSTHGRPQNAMPVILNVTLINGMGVTGKITVGERFALAAARRCLHVYLVAAYFRSPRPLISPQKGPVWEPKWGTLGQHLDVRFSHSQVLWCAPGPPRTHPSPLAPTHPPLTAPPALPFYSPRTGPGLGTSGCTSA